MWSLINLTPTFTCSICATNSVTPISKDLRYTQCPTTVRAAYRRHFLERWTITSSKLIRKRLRFLKKEVEIKGSVSIIILTRILVYIWKSHSYRAAPASLLFQRPQKGSDMKKWDDCFSLEDSRTKSKNGNRNKKQNKKLRNFILISLQSPKKGLFRRCKSLRRIMHKH